MQKPHLRFPKKEEHEKTNEIITYVNEYSDWPTLNASYTAGQLSDSVIFMISLFCVLLDIEASSIIPGLSGFIPGI